MFNLFWLWSEKFIREREGLGWLLGLQWVKDQLKLEKHPIKIFHLVSFHFCSSYLSSVRLILFHIYFKFVWISFQVNCNFISILLQFSFLFFHFMSFFYFILLHFSFLYFTLFYFILFSLILFYLLYYNLLAGQKQHLTPITALLNVKMKT